MTSASTTPGNAAILYHPEGYVTNQRGKLMGRHAAGEGFLRGLARHSRSGTLYAFAESREHFRQFSEQAKPYQGDRTTAWVPFATPERLADAGALFIPGPGLSPYAWQRQSRDARAFSITGVTHTICTDRVMDAIGDLLVAPTQEWDALICTSPAVKRGVDYLLESYGAYLAERFGSKPVRPRLQLPVIPLGVDCDQLGGNDDAEKIRKRVRKQHGIRDKDIAVLFFGRLSYHAKAHPLPMYQALEAAAKATGAKLHLIQAGWFPNDAIKQSFVQGARKVCPSVQAVFVDGRLPGIRNDIWRAADIFCSLSDNVQETFGLTPVEAMAAGLPVVASDWDGYRGTVEHGVTGFLVPTTMPGPGSGEELAYRYYTGGITYDQYIGFASQCIAVDADATAKAFIDLIGNDNLRKQMGERARERALKYFDWRVVIEAYEGLWGELAERRKGGSPLPAATGAPLRADPFAVFGHYATTVFTGSAIVRLAGEHPLKAYGELSTLSFNTFAKGILLPDEDIRKLLGRLKSTDGLPVAELEVGYRTEQQAAIRRTLGWLAKLGLVKVRVDGV